MLFLLIGVVCIMAGCQSQEKKLEQPVVSQYGQLTTSANDAQLIHDVENGEGEFFSPSCTFLHEAHLLFCSDFYIAEVDADAGNVEWVLDLRELFDKEMYEPGNIYAFLSTSLRIANTPNGQFIILWVQNESMYLLDTYKKVYYRVEIPYTASVDVQDSGIYLSNTVDPSIAHVIRLPEMSVQEELSPNVTKPAQPREPSALPEEVFNKIHGDNSQIVYRDDGYILYFDDSQRFCAYDIGANMHANTNEYSIRQPNTIVPLLTQNALIFFDDNEAFVLQGQQLYRFTKQKFPYADVDYFSCSYVYIDDNTNVDPFAIVLNYYDIDSKKLMSFLMDIKTYSSN